MKKMLVSVLSVALAAELFAGAAGLVFKGAMKTWDEVARIALKASGRTVSDDAVKVAAKTLKTSSEKYGDDVARASMRGGIEVAEQVAKQGGRFAGLIKTTARFSDDALHAMALNGDKAMRVCAKHGDGVVKAVAKLPVDDGTRLLGAIDRNPQVAKELMEGVEKGGKTFLDRLFAVNGRQILAGTLGTAAIVGTVRVTAPAAAEGEAVRQQTTTAVELAKSKDPLTKLQVALVDDWSKTTSGSRRIRTWGYLAVCLTLAGFAGTALLLYAVRRRRSKTGAPPWRTRPGADGRSEKVEIA